MNTMNRVLLSLCFVSLFFSCKKKTEICCHYESYIRPVSIRFAGYDSTEISSTILRKYNTNQGFRQPIDSVFGKDIRFIYSGDTTYENGLQFAIGANYDYTLTISDSVVYKITSKPNEDVKLCIEMEGHCSPGSSQTILHPLREIKVNEQETTISGSSTVSMLFYIYISNN